ncbi:MAG TPA: ParB/RepB/Spo0J family partition protein [Methanocella sp.]|nr:ParB/RepB/Spo0J family partition protein [Methanocella sp.]
MQQKDKCECIPISAIKVDSSHIRKKPGKVDNLKCTVSDVGLLQPILVRRAGEYFVVIDGERRLRAMRELAIPELIVGREVIVDVDETEADTRFKQVIANVQREDVDHFDLGHAFVMLKEKYGYQYREIAEIIGKTPHYVTSKVGLVKRLVPEVQDMAASDWEASKCIQDTFSDDEPDVYEMNVKIIEDIARLPAELQKMAYLTIKSKAMDINEALRYLRSMKKRHPKETVPGREPLEARSDLLTYLEKIDRNIDALAGRLRMGEQQNRQDLLNKLESSLEKLNLLYARLKGSPLEEADRSEALV